MRHGVHRETGRGQREALSAHRHPAKVVRWRRTLRRNGWSRTCLRLLPEPQLLSYGFHLDEDESRMTVVAVHPDAACVELHMEVGGEAFRGFADLIEVEGIEVYGEPTDRMMEQLRQKADALGEAGRVVVDRQYAGFARLDTVTSA